MGLEKRVSFNLQWGLLTVAIVAAAIPLLITLALNRPLDLRLILIETVTLAVIGIWGIYVAMKGIKRYDRALKEETIKHNRMKNYAVELERNIVVKDLFGDIITHDLMNPMGIIKNYAELLIEEERSEKNLAYLQSIQRNAVRVLDIIRDTGKLAKLESLEKLEYGKKDSAEPSKTS